MTTTFTYKYYDVYSLKHEGNFPYTYWETQPVAINGCPGIYACLKIFPNGNSDGKGDVSALIMWNGGDANTSIDVKTTVQINNTTKSLTYSVGKGKTREFGEGYGWAKFCGMDVIFKEPKTILQFTITIEKLIVKKDNAEIGTEPKGQQDILCYREGLDIAALKKEEAEAFLKKIAEAAKQPDNKIADNKQADNKQADNKQDNKQPVK